MTGQYPGDTSDAKTIPSVQSKHCKARTLYRQSIQSFLFGLVLTVILPVYLYSQETNSNRRLPVEYCGALTHQHQDFFGKAFSFTGLECFVVINQHYLAGAYASTFLSTLSVEVGDNPLYLYLWQTGLVTGISTNDSNRVHAGVLANVGAITMHYNSTDFSVLNWSEQETKRTGLVLVPQGFVEINLTRWLRTRVGLAYDFCVIEKQPQFNGTELQNISINFGFVFGTFKNSNTFFKMRNRRG